MILNGRIKNIVKMDENILSFVMNETVMYMRMKESSVRNLPNDSLRKKNDEVSKRISNNMKSIFLLDR